MADITLALRSFFCFVRVCVCVCVFAYSHFSVSVRRRLGSPSLLLHIHTAEPPRRGGGLTVATPRPAVLGHSPGGGEGGRGEHTALLALRKPFTAWGHHQLIAHWNSFGFCTDRRTKLQLQRHTFLPGSSLVLRSQSEMEDGPSSTSCFRRLTDCFLGASRCFKTSQYWSRKPYAPPIWNVKQAKFSNFWWPKRGRVLLTQASWLRVNTQLYEWRLESRPKWVWTPLEGDMSRISVQSCGQKSATISPGIHTGQGNSLRHGFAHKVPEIQLFTIVGL